MFGAGSPNSMLVLAALLLAAPAGARPLPSVAFFYGNQIPVERLRRFDWVVVEPDHVATAELEALQRSRVEVFAYLSLGEAAPGTVEPSWILAPNSAWGSLIVAPGADGWRQRVLDRVEALRARGYAGVFLDTLDSYAIALRDAEARRSAGVAMAALIRAIHQRHPELKLFFNRGFELIDEVGHLASGIAAESLFFSWNAADRRYVEVSAPDREWLAARLRNVSSRFGIPAVVVDYLPVGRREEALDAARRIQALGFVPWISTAALDTGGVGAPDVVAGVSAVEPKPRRVLLLYDGAETPSLARGPIGRLAAPALQSLGCDVDYVDVRSGLPAESIADRYAGVVTWFTDDDLPAAIRYPQWLAKQIASGVRVAIFGRPGFAVSRSVLSMLGLAAGPADSFRASRVVRRDEMIGLEAEPALRSRGVLRWHAVAPEVVVHLRLEDDRGQAIDPVVTAPWGGMALDPYVLERGFEGRTQWIVDPAKFLQAALGIAP
ncbi:MAG TPA: endo alpha-1,4 polygalactosaminidase [Myxococcaceae bacterium]|nr:endo alpha-1,4 polygalactosaminidase [Myxococcaceae bacterium]